MEWYEFLFMSVACLIGVIIGVVIEKLHHHKVAPWAGNVLIDLRRDCDDMIQIESPKMMSKWKDYKYLTYSVITFGELPRSRR